MSSLTTVRRTLLVNTRLRHLQPVRSVPFFFSRNASPVLPSFVLFCLPELLIANSWTRSPPRSRCRTLQVGSQERFHGEHAVAPPHDALSTPPVLGAGDGRSGRQDRFVLPVDSR